MSVKPLFFLSTLLFISFGLQAQEKKELTIEDIWKNGEYATEYIYGMRSMKDGLHYTNLTYDDKKEQSYVIKYAYKNGRMVDTLFNSGVIDPTNDSLDRSVARYELNADENKVLVGIGWEKIYRHSGKLLNFVYDIKSKTIRPLSGSGKQQCAAFSPNGNNIGFVRDNNIFIVDLMIGIEIQITTDGVRNEVINGKSDWVYEEEFAFDRAFFWSANGQQMAYYKFNEKDVKEYSMSMYNNLYPEEYRFKYPKAGEANSKVSIHLYDVASKETRYIKVGNNDDIYIPRLKWSNDSTKLLIYKMNRHQSKLEVLLANTHYSHDTIQPIPFFSEKSDTYIDITDDILFMEDGDHFIWTSEKSGYNHLYLYDMRGKQLRQITNGQWDVTEFNGFDKNTQRFYYTSTEESPIRRTVYSVNFNGADKLKISRKTGTNSFTFSNGFNYFMSEYSSANSPTLTTLHDIGGRQLRVLEENQKLKGNMIAAELQQKTFFSFTTENGDELNGWMIKPDQFDKFNKYPVFITTYGGPGSQTVLDRWGGTSYMWHQYLSKQGYFVVSVDNRGTGGRGVEFKKQTYKELGKLETIDQIEVAKYMSKKPYVDSKRIGIQGWSYGGYLSSLCILKGADHFKMAIAVAPVTNWRFYDSIYTERYMRTPQENPSGYDDNSPINHAGKLKGKYLIIHGTADDNVHFQNTAEMTTELIKQNKKFDSFFYPNKDHGIRGGNTRLHLYNLMTDYILENL
ncbi:MAG: S9 family peptidase [Flavobacteriales bacterium]|nr:S9 family peptidase [Flavobacteriales bacterium]